MSKIVCEAMCACGVFTSFVDFQRTPTPAHARSRRHQDYLARRPPPAPAADPVDLTEMPKPPEKS